MTQIELMQVALDLSKDFYETIKTYTTFRNRIYNKGSKISYN